MNTASDFVTSHAQLEALSGPIAEASVVKVLNYLHPHYQAMIAASPFALLATHGSGGLDISPRGDPAGFVHVQDEHTLLLPERRGNNRIDSLRNLLHDPNMALLFLIPGLGETLRVNGSAKICIKPEMLARFPQQGKLPKCVLEIHVERAFFQCARALHRSQLWQHVPGSTSGVAGTGKMLEALTDCNVDGDAYDAGLLARQKASLY